MLGWVKDKIGRKQSALDALVAGTFKDEAEKQALLEAVATTEGLKAEEVIPLLGLADPSIQQRASVLFLTRATQAAILALFDVVLTATPAARAPLMKTVIRLKPEALRHVVDLELRDAKQDRLKAAWETTLELVPEVSDAYVERAFKEGPPKTRGDALTRLMTKRSSDEMRPLFIVALDDREVRVRRIAVDALVKLQGNDVFEAMLDRIGRDDSPEIRQVAGGYLQKFIASAPPELRPTILGRLLLSGDAELRGQLVRAIFSTGSHYELLLEVLTFAKTVLGVQHESILSSLKTLGDVLIDHAIRVLGSADPDLRIQAILLLERYTSPKTLPAVLKLLEDEDWWVRIMACDTLGRLKDPRTLTHLGRLLTDPECKWAAIDAIGSVGGDGAFAALSGLVHDKQTEVRLAAVKSLGKMDDRRVDGLIEEVAKTDPTLDNRIRAVELLRERKGAKGGAEASVSSSHLTRPMEKLLAYAREMRASDLHVTPDEPPFLRLNGVIERMKTKALSRVQVDNLCDEVLDPVRRPLLAERGAVDFCYSIPGIGRYRVNVFRQLRGTSAVVRVIPNVPPTLADCGLPKHLDEIGMYHQGIILLTGPAGSGKSTSLTAFVNLLNETRNTHILSLEDPIEFLHSPKKALINQREIGRDTKSFAAAMRGALREDPDVIIVGELRDKETIRLAMVAAETGHLVIATMQTTGATATIDKIVESFPVDEQAQIRVQFAGSLKYIVSQQLVPRADGNGRVAAFEILKAISSVAAIIRDGKTFQLNSAMQIGRTQGMLTLDASLELLLAAGTITLETAFSFAQKKETFSKAARAAGPTKDPTPDATAAPPPRVAIPTLDVSDRPLRVEPPPQPKPAPRVQVEPEAPPPPPQHQARPVAARPQVDYEDHAPAPPPPQPAARPQVDFDVAPAPRPPQERAPQARAAPPEDDFDVAAAPPKPDVDFDIPMHAAPAPQGPRTAARAPDVDFEVPVRAPPPAAQPVQPRPAPVAAQAVAPPPAAQPPPVQRPVVAPSLAGAPSITAGGFRVPGMAPGRRPSRSKIHISVPNKKPVTPGGGDKR